MLVQSPLHNYSLDYSLASRLTSIYDIMYSYYQYINIYDVLSREVEDFNR